MKTLRRDGVCPRCGARRRGEAMSYCYPCHAAKAKERREKFPELVREIKLRHQEKKRQRNEE